MSSISVKFDISPDLNRVGDAIGGFDLAKELHDILTDVALTVESYAKQVTPVDTGRLRASIGTSFLIAGGMGSGGTAVVATHTNYAGFVHDGTRYMRARPFMKHGVDFAKQKYEGGHIAARLDTALRQRLSRL